MANKLYDQAKKAMLMGQLDLLTTKVCAALLDGKAEDGAKTLADVKASIVGLPQELQNKTVGNGRFDAADVVFPAVLGGQIEQMIFYKDTGDPKTSTLIAATDIDPVVPNGGNVNVNWSPQGILNMGEEVVQFVPASMKEDPAFIAIVEEAYKEEADGE